jgi:hypothetical protein
MGAVKSFIRCVCDDGYLIAGCVSSSARLVRRYSSLPVTTKYILFLFRRIIRGGGGEGHLTTGYASSSSSSFRGVPPVGALGVAMEEPSSSSQLEHSRGLVWVRIQEVSRGRWVQLQEHSWGQGRFQCFDMWPNRSPLPSSAQE